MENILFSTVVGFFAVFLTSVLGFTKFINDKEGKVSEFRQEWTNSIRETLSNLISSISTLFDLYEKSNKIAKRCNSITSELNSLDKESSEFSTKNELLQHNKNYLATIIEEIIKIRSNINQYAYNSHLHFKPNDTEYSHIESKIQNIENIISEVSEKLENGSLEEKTKYISTKKMEAEKICNEITLKSRFILKNEWERIKAGEDNYKKTKKIFKTSSLILTIIIIILFTLLLITKYSNYLATEKTKLNKEDNVNYHGENKNQDWHCELRPITINNNCNQATPMNNSSEKQ